jgi:hypothetical protein
MPSVPRAKETIAAIVEGEMIDTQGFWVLLIFLAIIIVPAVYFLMVRPALQQQKLEAELPHDGPIKVEITQEQIPAPSTEHSLHGGRQWWRMHINIKMSKSDYALYKQSGLMENELFAYPHPKFPDTDVSFAGLSIGYVKKCDFPSIQDLNAAKEELISGLQAVRSHLEAMKSGSTEPESIEI